MELILIIALASWFWETYNTIVKSAPSKWVPEEEVESTDTKAESTYVYAESSRVTKVFAALIAMGARSLSVVAALVVVAIPIGVVIVLISFMSS